MIAHVQTTINSVFAELDADGDVVRKFPYTIDVGKLSDDKWNEALVTLTKIREELKHSNMKKA